MQKAWLWTLILLAASGGLRRRGGEGRRHFGVVGADASSGGLSGAPDVKTVRDVYELMYREQRGSGGAYLLLNATGAIGSTGPQEDAPDVDAPLVHLRHLSALAAGAAAAGRKWVVLAPAADSQEFLARLAADPGAAEHVAGVLVDDTDPPARYSSLPPFPGAEFAPYPPGGHEWNPGGSGAALLRWPVPVLLLSAGMARDARERADYNNAQGHRGRAYHARIRMPMSAAPQGNASACLAARTCQPLGGFSVWAALPPIPAGANVTKPTTLVLAQVDGIDAFHDAIQGADAPLSGLVAMLSAVSALGALAPAVSGGYSRQLAFVALAGEPWGFMGSKAFLWELQRGGVTVQGLDLGLVDQVLEIGPVGRALQGGPAAAAQLFVHTQKGQGFGDASGLVSALQAAATDLPADLKAAVAPASASNPGVPPSSLMSFLRAKPSIAGAVLTEFDRAYSNPYQGSRFDAAAAAAAGAGGAAAFDASAAARAGAVVAGALHRLAGGRPEDFKANATQFQELAASFSSCLVQPDPGLACPAAAALMVAGYTERDGVRSYAPKHYVGVLQVLHPDSQNPAFKGDVPRFLWNAMAAATAGAAPRGAACDPVTHKCPVGQVCVGWRRGDSDPKLMGTCLNATARYVPALSTRITCLDCEDIYGAFRWAETNASDAWAAAAGWPPDPMWTESNWPPGAPLVRLYLLKPYGARVGVLVAGLLLTAAALAAALFGRRKFSEHLKSS